MPKKRGCYDENTPIRLMRTKKNLIKLYNLPEKIQYCKKCTISNQRPRISFDKDGVCSACNYNEYKRNQIDWEARKIQLIELLNKHRKTDGSFDVIVPCSGGKDGSYVAHKLKYEYDMNPLCVTWAPLQPTDIGRKNLDSFIASGFNHLLATPNPQVTRKLTKLAFTHLGDPFQPFIYGQTNFPLHAAVQNNVSLIMYGENGEVEYGGDMKNAFKPTRDISDHNYHYFSGMPPEYWIEHGITMKELKPYSAPRRELVESNNTEIHFFGYYEFWDPQENYYYCREKTKFEPNAERSEGTYSKYASLDDKFDGFHYYLSFIKFGIGRTTSDTAHEIRDDKIDREEGIELIRKYDGEFPKKYLKEFLEYCKITKQEYDNVIDSWRSEHIWGQDESGIWNLKSPIWEN